MRHLPNTLAVLFIAITLSRVADLTANALGAGVLGWVFALGLGAGVYVSAYWTKTADRRLQQSAGLSLAFFVVCDLVFNGAEVYRYMRSTGALADGVLVVAGVFYAIFPTAAAGLLGWLQGHVDRQPRPPQRTPFWRRIRLALYAGLDRALPAAVEESAELPEASGSVVQALPPASTHRRKLAELTPEERAELPALPAAVVAERYGVSERSAREWRRIAAERAHPGGRQ